MRIKDGSGSGREARVNIQNRLEVESISQSVEHRANLEGKAWNLVVQRTPTAAGDYFFYFKNTGTESYVLEGFTYRVASAESVQLWINKTGTAAGGTALTPVNVNGGSSRVISATIETGVDITGLANGEVADRIWMTNTATQAFNFEQDIFLPPGSTFSIEATTGGVQIDMVIVIHELRETDLIV
jgi:hypothetical protein